MSAPVFLIVFPGLVAALFIAIPRLSFFKQVLGTVICALLCLIAWQLPIGEPIHFGVPRLPPLVITDSLIILGRRLWIDSSLKHLVALIYLMVGLWFLGSFTHPVSRLFVPSGLGMAALISASLAVDPPLYAVLFVVLTGLASIPLVSPPDRPVSTAALRFLTFQLIGMGLFLIADSFFSLVPTEGENLRQLSVAAVAYGLGLTFLAGVFPFHTWIPMLAEKANPIASSFVIFIIPVSVIFIGLRYLNTYATIEIYPIVQDALRAIGTLMIVVGGVWAAIERHLGRIMGFTLMVQLGIAITALSLVGQFVQEIPLAGLFISLLIPQSTAIVLLSIALNTFIKESAADPGISLRLNRLQGSASLFPFASAGLVIAILSLAGLPILGNYPPASVIWVALMQRSPPAAYLSIAGSVGLVWSGLRTMAVLTMDPEQRPWRSSEPRLLALIFAFGIALLILLGIAPGLYVPGLARLALLAWGQPQ